MTVQTGIEHTMELAPPRRKLSGDDVLFRALTVGFVLWLLICLVIPVAALGIDEVAPEYSLTLEMRHVGQAFEVAVELPPEGLSNLTYEELREAFSQAHLRAYSYPATPGKAIEVVSFRLGTAVKTDKLPRIRPQDANGQNPRRSYDLHLRDRTIACVGTTRADLGSDEILAGPAIVDDVSSTIFVPQGWAARLVAGASLEILREDRAK